MRPIRFLLVNPSSPLWRVERPGAYRGPRTFRFSMLSSLYVAAAAPDNVETRIIDEDVEPVDFDADVDLVGISFMTFNAPRAYEIADEFRRRGKTVIFGGYHPSFMPEEAGRHADAVCVGEAEGTLPRLIADFGGGRLQSYYRSEPVDLRGLRIPDRSLIRASAYLTPDVVQATRGCPYRCTFCSVAAFARYRFRARPVDEVIDELRGLGRYLLFMDDNIIGDRDYACELFARMAPLGKRWFSQCSIRIADDAELLRSAAASGCRGLFVGLESVAQDNLKAWRKTFNRASDYSRAIARLHDAGIAVYAGLVFGMDGDSPDIFARSLDFLYESHVDALQATLLTPFPGTPLFDEMDRQGRIVTRDWSLYDFAHVVFEPLHMSPETLRVGKDWVQSRFYSRRSVLRRTLQAFSYLNPAIMLRAHIPLNLGYRRRHRACGTFRRGRPFDSEPAQRCAASTAIAQP
ncbi:MAG: radical SAM protein [Gemmatimonadales bacterium]